uniref:Uncharacterized protein n=1 Tax=Cajanus cajan TaxID=3821 RepID=A0A151RWX8_CAJCA|nr:hypothetical protein KK1_031283 [Cajanus cajan]
MYNCCVQNLKHFYGLRYCSAKDHFIWLSIIWTIWLTRNDLIFSSKIIIVSKMLNLMQLRSWRWLRVRFPSFNYNLFYWSNSHSVCLS